MFYLIFADKRGHFCENATEHRVEYRFANNVKPETGPAARNRSAPKTSRIDRNSTGSRPPNFRYGPRVHHRFPRLDEFQSSNERRGSKRTIVLFFSFLSFFLLLLREYINEKRAQTIFLETAAAPFLGKRRGEITAARILRRLRGAEKHLLFAVLEAILVILVTEGRASTRSHRRTTEERGWEVGRRGGLKEGERRRERLWLWDLRTRRRTRQGSLRGRYGGAEKGEREEKTIRRKEKEEEEGKRR